LRLLAISLNWFQPLMKFLRGDTAFQSRTTELILLSQVGNLSQRYMDRRRHTDFLIKLANGFSTHLMMLLGADIDHVDREESIIYSCIRSAIDA